MFSDRIFCSTFILFFFYFFSLLELPEFLGVGKRVDAYDEQKGSWYEGTVMYIANSDELGTDKVITINYNKFGKFMSTYSALKQEGVRAHVVERLMDRKQRRMSKKEIDALKEIIKGEKVYFADGLIELVTLQNDPMNLKILTATGWKRYEDLMLRPPSGQSKSAAEQVVEIEDEEPQPQPKKARKTTAPRKTAPRKTGPRKTAPRKPQIPKKKKDKKEAVLLDTALPGSTDDESEMDESDEDNGTVEDTVENVQQVSDNDDEKEKENDFPLLKPKQTISTRVTQLENDVRCMRGDVAGLKSLMTEEFAALKNMMSAPTPVIPPAKPAKPAKPDNILDAANESQAKHQLSAKLPTKNTSDLPIFHPANPAIPSTPKPPARLDTSASTSDNSANDIMFDLGTIDPDVLNDILYPQKTPSPATPREPLRETNQTGQIINPNKIKLFGKDYDVFEERAKIVFLTGWGGVKDNHDKRHKFSVEVLEMLYTKDELKGKNCSGYVPSGPPKKALKKEHKFSMVHDIVFQFWSVEGGPAEQAKAWKECCKHIDSHLRSTVNKAKPKAPATVTSETPNKEN